MKNRLIELLGKADEATEILTGDFPSYEEELKAFYSGITEEEAEAKLKELESGGE